MIGYRNQIEAQLQATYLEGALEMEKMLNNFANQDLGSQPNQDFFQDNNDNQNKALEKNQNRTVTQKLRLEIS